MKELRFYICEHCGNIVYKIEDAGVAVVCCGEKMKCLEPGTVDASREKHIPVITSGEGQITVSVGSAAHPMTNEHGIRWVCLRTEDTVSFKYLSSGSQPNVSFYEPHSGGAEVYAYCNLHGLWKAVI